MNVRFLSVLLGALLLAIIGVAFSRPAGPLFGPSGTLAIVTYTIPTPSELQNRMFGLGVGDIRMVTPEGATERLGGSRTHHVLLGKDSVKTVIASQAVRPGDHTHLQFTLKNPELRMDEAADTIRRLSLWSEDVSLEIPYTINEDETTVILIGFEVAGALRDHENELVYVPTLHVEARQGVQITEQGGAVEIEGGTIRMSAVFGMNDQGAMQKNYRMPLTAPQDAQPATLPENVTENENTPVPESNVEDVEQEESDETELSIEETQEEPALTQE